MKSTTEPCPITAHMARALPRLLTQLCRDEDSPLFGCFDRHHWHYKMRDFPSMVLQQGVSVLDLLARGALELPGASVDPRRAAQWRDAALGFWARAQRRDGSYDEYYPFESGFPPTAFSLYAAGVVAQHGAVPSEAFESMKKASDFLLRAPETQAINQEIVALSGCSLAKGAGVATKDDALARRWDAVFAGQSSEGWFAEYDGADTGYLAVACDALYDYYEVSADERALLAMKSAAGYIHHLLDINNGVPAMINSRNTDYIVPYGLSRLGAKDPVASAVVQRLVRDIEAPRHFLHHIDDRYLGHYVYTSWFRALDHLPALTEAAPDPSGPHWFPEARIFVQHTPGLSSLHIAAGKGGVVFRTGADGSQEASFGWRGVSGGEKITTTHWQEPEAEVTYTQREGVHHLTTKMPLMKHGFLVPTVIKHIGLRVLGATLGKRLIPFLKRMVIFRKARTGDTFERAIKVSGDEVEITDSLTGTHKTGWQRAGWSSLRHVSSAGGFSFFEAAPARLEHISHTNDLAKP